MTDYVLGFGPDYAMPAPARAALASSPEFGGVFALASETVAKGDLAVNVADFGTVGDGVTDDWEALQNALDSAAGRLLVIPAGEYACGDALRLPAGVTILGYGATLHKIDTGAAHQPSWLMNWPAGDTTTTGYSGRGGIRIFGLTFDAHGDTVADEANILTFDHAKSIRVQDCTFRRTHTFHALELNAVDGALVDGCRFEGFIPNPANTEKEAIQIDCAAPGDSGAADNTMARNITIRDCVAVPYSATIKTHHLLVGSHSQAGFYDNIRVHDCYIDSPTVRGVGAYYWRGSSIRDVHVKAPVAEGIRLDGCSSVIVDGCYVDTPGAGAGTASTRQGVAVYSSTGCKVLATQVLNAGDEGIYIAPGTTFCDVKDCTVKLPRTYGVTVNDASNILVSANLIHGAGTPSGALSALRATGTTLADNISFIGNKHVKRGSGTEVSAGVSVAAGVTNVQAVDNDFLGLAAATSGTVNTTSNRI